MSINNVRRILSFLNSNTGHNKTPNKTTKKPKTITKDKKPQQQQNKKRKIPKS